ncbi:hypothetical protein DPV78_004357 [Talaromyces pinophilus]|nr:hypothetical protein DPV78_004357 [Talaromyces pinophilus]
MADVVVAIVVVVVLVLVGGRMGRFGEIEEIEEIEEKREELYVREVEERSRDVGRICGLGGEISDPVRENTLTI